MKLDILAFAAHPDDVEICAAGTIIKHVSKGKKAGIIDLTRGELGTRGNAELRAEEARAAAEIIGLSVRENLAMSDGFLNSDRDSLLQLVRKIRRYRPEIILANAIRDRHPDHGKAAAMVSEAVFLAGLLKVETIEEDSVQQRWKTKAVYHYIQDRYIKPDLLVDISDFIEKKMESIMAYKSQFYVPGSEEPETPISSEAFLKSMKERPAEWGRSIGVAYAEAFTSERSIGVADLFDLI